MRAAYSVITIVRTCYLLFLVLAPTFKIIKILLKTLILF